MSEKIWMVTFKQVNEMGVVREYREATRTLTLAKAIYDNYKFIALEQSDMPCDCKVSEVDGVFKMYRPNRYDECHIEVCLFSVDFIDE